MFYARLVSDPSCSCRAYHSGRSFNHVLSPPPNYQTAPMRIKPPSRWFEIDADWCILAGAGLGVEVANSLSHVITNTFAMHIFCSTNRCRALYNGCRADFWRYLQASCFLQKSYLQVSPLQPQILQIRRYSHTASNHPYINP